MALQAILEGVMYGVIVYNCGAVRRNVCVRRTAEFVRALDSVAHMIPLAPRPRVDVR